MKRKFLLFLAIGTGWVTLNAQTGNVGIGTTMPGTKLDVNGAITNRETTVAVAANAIDGRCYSNCCDNGTCCT
jgi:hypothetical protein